MLLCSQKQLLQILVGTYSEMVSKSTCKVVNRRLMEG